MKRILPLFVVLPFILAGCVREPYADFNSSAVVVETYENIHFYNRSDNYRSLEWDFDDGTFSINSNPVHYYEFPGIYTVMLTAYGYHGEVDRAYQDIEVIIPTILEITVLEYYDRYPVPDVSVILYPTYYDWENEVNAVTDGHGNILEGFTDASGVVTFTGLDPISYYVDVWHEHYNNYQLANEDLNFIRTRPLTAGLINTFTAYVDYIPSSSKKAAHEISKKTTSTLKRTFKDTQGIRQQPSK